MGKLRIVLITSLILAVMMTSGAVCAFSEVSVSSERTTVVNLLPDVTVYMDTDKAYDMNAENTKIYVDETEADVKTVKTFKKLKQGITYFILVDTSKSISEDEFAAIKEGILSFGDSLTEKDKVYLIPFGESVYSFDRAFDPTDSEFRSTVEGIERKDDFTQLYTAIDSVVTIAKEDKENSAPERNVALVFTDGVDETTGGQITGDEAKRGMLEQGIPLYAFAVGDDKEGKDSLGVFCRALNGCVEEVDEGSLVSKLSDLERVLDNTLVVEAAVRNSEDIVNEFDLRIQVDGSRDIVVKNDITAHKSEDSKDVFSVALKKLILKYWWVIVIVAVALIVFIALMVIKRNKGVVNVDGKVVYGSKIEKKYHMQVREHNTRKLKMTVSMNGGKSVEKEITLVESVIIGRSSMCDVYFDDVNMSRQHFSIETINGELYINDLDSTSGTYLNGVRLYMKQRLRCGDIVTAGKVKIRIEW